MKQLRVVFAVAALSLLACRVLADPIPDPCSPPSPPPRASLRPEAVGAKPEVPGCVDLIRQIQTCRKGEYNRYKAALGAYNGRVETWNIQVRVYGDAMDSWVRSMRDYANCEIDAINAERPR